MTVDAKSHGFACLPGGQPVHIMRLTDVPAIKFPGEGRSERVESTHVMVATNEQTAPRVSLRSLDTVWFQVAGTVCNLACGHCLVSSSPTNHTHEAMTLEQVLPFLELARRLTLADLTGPVIDGSISVTGSLDNSDGTLSLDNLPIGLSSMAIFKVMAERLLLKQRVAMIIYCLCVA